MMEPWRPLALAAAFNVAVSVGVGTAQTVIVKNAPPGSTIELVLNVVTIGSAAAASTGDATLAVDLSKHVGRSETDANVYVDVCGKLRRVLLVERGLQPPPQGEECSRRELPGLFLVRGVTTMVVDVAGPIPTMWLRQGPAPAEWLTQGSERPSAAKPWGPLPTGLMLFGGGGFVRYSDAVAVACGNVTDCAGDGFRLAYTVGAAYWFTPFLAAEATYMKPADATAAGSGDTYRFNSFLDTRVVTLAGNVGVPIGRVRLYGQLGMNYQQGTFSTTQTHDDVTVTVDEVPQTIKGGTQTFELKTSGWGWLFGGGVEIWVSRSLALYAEGGRARLKGQALDGGEGQIDDRVTFILAGARVHIGR